MKFSCNKINIKLRDIISELILCFIYTSPAVHPLKKLYFITYVFFIIRLDLHLFHLLDLLSIFFITINLFITSLHVFPLF